MDTLSVGIFNTQPPHLYFGGVERRIMEIAKRLKGKVNIKIYSGTKAGFKNPVSINGTTVFPCFSTDIFFPVDNWFFNWTLSKNIDSINCDIYESHTVSGFGILRHIEKGVAKPLIETIHGVLADEYAQTIKSLFPTLRLKASKIFMQKLVLAERKLAQRADLIVTVSRYSLRKIVENYDVSEDKIMVVPSGVDVEKFKPVSELEKIRLKHRLGLGARECVLFIGSLIPRKGVHYLLEVARNIVKENNDVSFIIVGEGPLKGYITKFSKKAGLQNNLRLFGNISENFLPKIYNCADVFVSPSLQEGQGLTLLEAQSSGVPIVAFSVGAVPENVLNRETGILVNLNSEEMAEAILRILTDKTLKDKMGLNGRNFAYMNFSWEKCAETMLKVYREVVR
jgi:glycosyltransferase involved in cell wall biosynthesis